MTPALGSRRTRIVLALATLSLASLQSQPPRREQVGPSGESGFLLSSGWRIQPAGRQIPLDSLPQSSVTSPDGKHLLVLNSGYKPPSISVIEIASGRVVSSVPVPDAWIGLAVAPKSDRVYVGGGASASIFEFRMAGARLEPARTFEMVPREKRTPRDFAGDVAFSPDGRLLYVTDLYGDSVVVINPQSGTVINRFKTGRRPYRILFHPDGKTFFVTHWAEGTLGHYDASNGSPLEKVRLGAHPTDVVWRDGPPADVEGEAPWVSRLFVAAANTNNVYAVSVSPAKELRVVETINVALLPGQPLGMTPSALALSADSKRLFVACSDANAAAVVDVTGERSRVEGFIPAGWYPTALRALPDGALIILNGKGGRSHPRTGAEPAAATQTGTASWIDAFTPEQLAAWSSAALANAAQGESQATGANPVPGIQHVVYILKENRSYDQVLGDLKEGNGDAALVEFGANVTPNQHKLAREFVLLDNFYVNGDVDADGLNWSVAAIAPDYVQRLWPATYAGRRRMSDYEGQDPVSFPPAGYLWTNAAMGGLSLRNFGFMVENRAGAPAGSEQVARVRDPALAKATNPLFRGPDLEHADADRAKAFLAELAQYEQKRDMPRLIVMRLGNDRATDTPGKTAASLVADNDHALGLIVEGVSKSRFWESTAIFVLEDDAQGGKDHVDSHRSPAFVISPYVRRHVVDGTMYNTASMLRTIELLLGLRPMTHFDAGARPMTPLFQKTPNAAPYAAEKPRI